MFGCWPAVLRGILLGHQIAHVIRLLFLAVASCSAVCAICTEASAASCCCMPPSRSVAWRSRSAARRESAALACCGSGALHVVVCLAEAIERLLSGLLTAIGACSDDC